jgi:lysosomal acid lipase/cholesteryl ester hydrolase
MSTLCHDKILNSFLNVVALLVQLPMLVFHALGIEQYLSSFHPMFNKPDNLSTSFTGDTFFKDSPNSSDPEFDSETETDVSENKPSLQEKVINATDIVDIVHAHGYKVHEHVVQTKDGYLLSIHRILGQTGKPSNAPVVYMHHGLLTNSELFLLGETTSKCLPFILVDNGYDVWLGNNRGNKYSRKHLILSSTDEKFWNYSLDEFAMFDIPNTIDYILKITQRKNLSYIGFSQGSAQCLAALSLNHDLNQKINVFIGLSPAMIPRGLNNPVCSYLVGSGSGLLYRIFGKRAILPSVVFWQKIMGPGLYETVVDKSLVFLFNWKSGNITTSQKKVGYPHMFSPSSVKSVVHWFQIIDNKRFQMFDEGGASGSKLVYFSGTSKKNNRVAPFSTQTITTPCLLIYGKSDMLIDIDKTLENLSCEIETIGLDGYEHMDTLWSSNVEKTVFANVIERLTRANYP